MSEAIMQKRLEELRALFLKYLTEDRLIHGKENWIKLSKHVEKETLKERIWQTEYILHLYSSSHWKGIPTLVKLINDLNIELTEEKPNEAQG